MSSSMVVWCWQSFAELKLEQLHAILAARQEVFIVGQALNYVDADHLDREAWHLSAWHEGQEGSGLAAYLRVVPLDGTREKYLSPSDLSSGRRVYKIGRVLTRPAFRGRGLGLELMEQLLNRVAENWGPCRLTMSAQSYLEAFYQKFEFEREGEPYLEEGLEHIRMSRNLSSHLDPE